MLGGEVSTAVSTAETESVLGLLARTVSAATIVELVLAAIIVVLAFAAPNLGGRVFTRLEQGAAAVRASPTQQILAVGLLAIVARALFLPWLGPPVPWSHDEHSLILQAQTFLQGRLANPVPASWEHFESIHLNVVPAYASMYFPGRGLHLALGMLAGHPWIGVWLVFALMCMAAVWMLQAWVPAPFAFLAGVLIVLRLGIFSYWINSYWGGAPAALGAMLIVGAMPRFLRQPRWSYGLLLGLGGAILLLTRPVEGVLLCLPLAVFFILGLWKRSSGDFGRTLLRAGIPAVLLLALSGGLMLAYNNATTGDALVTPYDLNRQMYAITPAFLFSPRPEGEKRGPPHFRRFYQWEDLPYADWKQPAQLARKVASKIYYNWNFYVGFILTPALLAGLWAARRQAILLVTLGIFMVGYLLQTWNFPHYTAPIFPVLLIILMKGFAWLREWRPRGRATGLFLTRAMPAAILLSLLLPASAVITGEPAVARNRSSLLPCCAIIDTSPRAEIIAQLRALPGKDLVLVSTDPKRHPIHMAMVYNEPDIGRSEVIWAHLLGPERDRMLLANYPGRRVWEVQWKDDATPMLVPSNR